MPLVSVQVTVPEELGRLLARLGEMKGQQVGEMAAKAVAPQFTRGMIDLSGVVAGFGPSGFSRGWLAEADGAGLAVTNTIGPLATVIELPTKPHVIMARPGTHLVTKRSKLGKVFSYQAPNVLAWMPGRGAFSAAKVNASTKAGQKWIFAKKVNHPGTPGKNVFETFINVGGGDQMVFDALIAAARQMLWGH